MASIGHLAVGIAAGRLAHATVLKRSGQGLARLMIAGSVLACLPDLDIVGLALGVPYAMPLGHRGASHSLVFALAVGLVAGAIAVAKKWPAVGVAAMAFATVASHGTLDAMTNGGRGIAFFWPFSSERFFFPWRPIGVAPIGLRLVSPRGLALLGRELLYFSPLFVYAWWPRRARASAITSPTTRSQAAP